MRLKLLVFDVDGTLVDSQNSIVAAMTAAFDAAGRTAPSRAEVLTVVGLSLPLAIGRLAPDAGEAEVDAMTEAYKAAFVAARAGGAEGAAFYPGAREALDDLARIPDLLLGIATGKSRRGLDIVLENHGLTGFFHTIHTSDHHPSKPHPAMLQAALADCGIAPADAAMLGDTTFDMEMACAAGVAPIGVSWGYHPPERLAGAGADIVLNEFGALRGALDMIWS